MDAKNFNTRKSYFIQTKISTYNEPELGSGIDPVMALTLFTSSILDAMRFEPTTFQS